MNPNGTFIRLVPGSPADVLPAVEEAGAGGVSRLVRRRVDPTTVALPHGCVLRVELRPRRLSRWVPMEIHLNRWSPWFTQVEMVPLRRVRPTRGYFRSGHRLLDAAAIAQPTLLRPGVDHTLTAGLSRA